MSTALAGPLDLHAFVSDELTLQSVTEAAQLTGLAGSMVHAGGIAAATQFLAQGKAPAVLLVDLSEAEDMFAAMDRLADECEQHTRVIALGSVNDIRIYRKLIDMGVSDYLVKPLNPPVVAAALQRVRNTFAPAPDRSETARVTAVIGARGGVGASSIATSLAWTLAHRHGRRTVLVDLDLQFGSVAMNLDLEPSRGLREILASPDRIDTLLIASAVSQESERLRVLSTEESLASEITVGEQGLKALLDALGPDSDEIVLDVPRRLDVLGRCALARADIRCIVADLTLVSMRDTQRLLKLCEELNPAGQRILIGNRSGAVAGEVPQPEFERGIGARFDYRLPEDARAASAAADQGKSLIESAADRPFAAEIDRLVRQMIGSSVAGPEEGAQKSLLKRLFG